MTRRLSPLTRRRLHNFRANRRGFWSLWIFTALFGASQYPPNIAAVECILSAAGRLPDITFLVLGTVCNFVGFRRALPANVLMLGQLSDALPGRKPTRGGSSETDVNDPMVRPTGRWPSCAVTTVTPVGK